MCHDYIQSSLGKAIAKFNFSSLFSQAWLKTCLPRNICSGFEKAGIIPLNPDRLLKRCPGTEGAVKIREKKKSECSEEILTDTQSFQSSLPVCLGAWIKYLPNKMIFLVPHILYIVIMIV